MTAIIENQIRHSLGDANYDRVIEMLGVMRDELVGYEEPKLFNNFLRQVKEKLLKDELGGDRRELWWLIRRHKLALIDNNMSEQSDVTEEEAKRVRILCRKEYWVFMLTNFSSCLRNDIYLPSGTSTGIIQK